jgi:hypothetical protein
MTIEEETTSMTRRGWLARIPFWARVSGIIVLVLAGVVAAAIFLGAVGSGDTRGGSGGHGSGHGDSTGTAPGAPPSPGGAEPGPGHMDTDGGHGSGDHQMGAGGHDQGQGEQAGRSEPELSTAAQVITFTIDDMTVDGTRVGGRA